MKIHKALHSSKNDCCLTLRSAVSSNVLHLNTRIWITALTQTPVGAAFFLHRRLKDIQSDYWESRAALRNSVVLSFIWRRTHRLDKCRLNRVSVADTGDVLRRVLVIVGRICVCGLLIQKVYDKHSRAHRGGLNLKNAPPRSHSHQPQA